MDHQEARHLASKIAIWYFQNNLGGNVGELPLGKRSAKKPKMSDTLWAKLMTEAISSFYEGLDIELEGRCVQNGVELYNSSIDFVGTDAFRNIAFVVSAAGATQPLQQEVEQSFEAIQEGPGGEEGQTFAGPGGLAGLIATDADAQAYGQASTVIMTIESSPPSHALYQQSSKSLTDLSGTPNLSPPFSRALASLGAQYLRLADEMTAEVTVGEEKQEIGESGVGVSGLPTGVSIAHRQRLIAIRKRVIREAKRAA